MEFASGRPAPSSDVHEGRDFVFPGKNTDLRNEGYHGYPDTRISLDPPATDHQYNDYDWDHTRVEDDLGNDGL